MPSLEYMEPSNSSPKPYQVPCRVLDLWSEEQLSQVRWKHLTTANSVEEPHQVGGRDLGSAVR